MSDNGETEDIYIRIDFFMITIEIINYSLDSTNTKTTNLHVTLHLQLQ